MPTTGSEFVRVYAPKGFAAWEAAALAFARGDGLCPWPFVPLTLSDDQGNVAVLQVQTDDLAIGTLEDHVRLPLTPNRGQDILNLRGWLLPTPWLVYQIWRAAPIKLEPQGMSPNLGASLTQYAAHSTAIDLQVAAQGAGPEALRAGVNKSIVVSNIAIPHKVLLFGWYRPPPAPDVFDNGRGMSAPDRQPIQPCSNVHGDFYVDYSHGIRAILGTCVVNGQPMATCDLYQHPALCHLVSNEGPDGKLSVHPSPVRLPRYPANVPPAVLGTSAPLPPPLAFATTPGLAEQGLTLLRRGVKI